MSMMRVVSDVILKLPMITSVDIIDGEPKSVGIVCAGEHNVAIIYNQDATSICIVSTYEMSAPAVTVDLCDPNSIKKITDTVCEAAKAYLEAVDKARRAAKMWTDVA